MTCTNMVDCFKLTCIAPGVRVDSQLAEVRHQQQEKTKNSPHIVHKFLAKQGSRKRQSNESVNRGNFIATLQLLAKGNSTLDKQLKLVSKNAKYKAYHVAGIFGG